MQIAHSHPNDAATSQPRSGASLDADTPPPSKAELLAAGVKALRAAADYGHWDLFKSLLERSRGPLYGALPGEALVVAAEQGDTKTVASLVTGNADIRSRLGEALARAAGAGHAGIAKFLSDHRAQRALRKSGDRAGADSARRARIR